MRNLKWIISILLTSFVIPIMSHAQQIRYQHNWDDGNLACARPESYCDCHSKGCHECVGEKMMVVDSPGGKPGKSFRSKLWNCDERAEIGWEHVPWRGKSGEERWYAYSLYFENENFAGGGAAFITQFGHRNDCGGIGSHIKVTPDGTVKVKTFAGKCTTLDVGKAQARKWHRIVVHTNWASSKDGYFEVYWDGVKTVNIQNESVYFSGVSREPYVKIGLYNGDPWKGPEPAAIYMDDFVAYGPDTKLCDVIPTAQGCGGKPTPTPTPIIKSVTLNLSTGWNLVSLPIEPSDNAIDKVLASINGKYSAVYAYDGNDYQSYIPGASSGNTLSTMSAGTGYWIFMTETATLEIKGKTASKTVALKKNWNLVGYNSTQSASVEQALKSIEGKYSAVYGFDTASNSYVGYVPGAGSNELTNLEAGNGYWILVSNATAWTIP
jgi:hypothetical protein